MCTSFMGSWEEKLPDVEQRVSFVFVARSPIARLIEAKKARGWTRHKVHSDVSGDYTRDYVSAADADVPGYNVFTRRDGVIRHFWGGEMGGVTADPGQDPRGAPISIRSGRCSTPHRKVAARTGIRSSIIDRETRWKSAPLRDSKRESSGLFRLPYKGLR